MPCAVTGAHLAHWIPEFFGNGSRQTCGGYTGLTIPDASVRFLGKSRAHFNNDPLQRRKINRHDFPKDLIVNLVMAMPEDVSDTSDLPPRDVWISAFQIVGMCRVASETISMQRSAVRTIW